MGTPVSDRVIMLYILFYTYFGREAYTLTCVFVLAIPSKHEPVAEAKAELRLIA